eukprot:7192516-Prymnesium_polylepis.1
MGVNPTATDSSPGSVRAEYVRRKCLRVLRRLRERSHVRVAANGERLERIDGDENRPDGRVDLLLGVPHP